MLRSAMTPVMNTSFENSNDKPAVLGMPFGLKARRGACKVIDLSQDHVSVSKPGAWHCQSWSRGLVDSGPRCTNLEVPSFRK